MPLPVPNLDDRNYDQLAAEARALITRYFPAWTDHNPSDPGITLLELFAFFMESSIYQINRVPTRSLRHFAALAGVTQQQDQDGNLEPMAQTLHRAITAARLNYRAITASEFEALALSFRPQVARARAVVVVERAATVFPADRIVKLVIVTRLAADFLIPPGPILPGVPVQFWDRSITGPADIVRWEWNFGDGTSDTAQNPTHRYARQGRYSVTLTVYDEAGNSDFCTRQIAVLGRILAITSDKVAREDSNASAPMAGNGDTSALDDLRQQIFQLLRARSLITTRIQVVLPQYQAVAITVKVVRKFRSRLESGAVRQAISGFLSPYVGGVNASGWEFGRSLFRSELYQVIEGLDGVDHVSALLLDNDEKRAELPLGAPTALIDPINSSINVTVADI